MMKVQQGIKASTQNIDVTSRIGDVRNRWNQCAGVRITYEPVVEHMLEVLCCCGSGSTCMLEVLCYVNSGSTCM
jgi:hypothetical protein